LPLLRGDWSFGTVLPADGSDMVERS
jgi:hypothetical protein